MSLTAVRYLSALRSIPDADQPDRQALRPLWKSAQRAVTLRPGSTRDRNPRRRGALLPGRGPFSMPDRPRTSAGPPDLGAHRRGRSLVLIVTPHEQLTGRCRHALRAMDGSRPAVMRRSEALLETSAGQTTGRAGSFAEPGSRSRCVLRPDLRPQPRAATSERQRPLICRFSRFAARFSSKVFVAFFFVSFFLSMPLLIGIPLVQLKVVRVYVPAPMQFYVG